MKKKTKKVKKLTVSKVKKQLDSVFSQYIRQRDKGKCITCGAVRDWKLQHASHFRSRMHNATRFDEKNVHAQCPMENIYKHGDIPVYALRLQELYGPSIIKELVDKSREIKRWTIPELTDLIAHYKGLILSQ